MTRSGRLLPSHLRFFGLCAALAAAFAINGGISTADEPWAESDRPAFYEEAIDFLYTTESGEMIPGRMFAMYALDDPGAPSPAPLSEWVNAEIGPVVDPEVTAAYTHISYGWRNGRPPAFTINPSGMPYGMTQRQGIEAILNGADVWRYDGLEFTYAGETKQFTNVVKPDGKFTVTFGFAMPPQAIGVAMLWCPGCLGGPIEYDIQFKIGWPGWTYDQLMSTSAHEFGHVAGLGHETKGCGDREGPVMCPAAGSTFPGEDDFAGIKALYGGEGPPFIPQPARYTGLLPGFKVGQPTIGDLVLAINPLTGATCGFTTLKMVELKPAFSLEVYGAFRSKPGCPVEGGSVRFYFPKTKHWSTIAAPWSPGADLVNGEVTTESAKLTHKRRVAGVTGD